jgi:hypothetical protein
VSSDLPADPAFSWRHGQSCQPCHFLNVLLCDLHRHISTTQLDPIQR